MRIFTRTEVLSNWLDDQRSKGRSIGFVPTMGALHEGHASLITHSVQDNDLTVCSIFVNPSQFDDSEDLLKYPRNHDQDMAMLMDLGCEVTYLPSVMEVYPPGMKTKVDVDLKGIDQILEGKFRPGHFDGMMEVVNRLLDIIKPNRLYMGQKDHQQHTIVQHMIDALDLDVDLVVCPIIRDPDGLAQSSRNVRLSPENRQKGLVISQTLHEIAKQKGERSVLEVKEWAFNQLSEAGLKPEYVAIRDADSLDYIETWQESEQPIALIAAWAGDIRLIDNMRL